MPGPLDEPERVRPAGPLDGLIRCAETPSGLPVEVRRFRRCGAILGATPWLTEGPADDGGQQRQRCEPGSAGDDGIEPRGHGGLPQSGRAAALYQQRRSSGNIKKPCLVTRDGDNPPFNVVSPGEISLIVGRTDMMSKGIAAILGGLALLAVISVKPAEAACVPPHWAPGHWTVYGAWMPPRWVPGRCVAFIAPPLIRAPLPVVAVRPYWRPWPRPIVLLPPV
jgi:hypothetical protein